MAYKGLTEFIADLERRNELIKIGQFVNPFLEITEITDRVTKSGGKALLFQNTGTSFPVLINAYGSDARMAMATGRADLDDAGKEIDDLFHMLTAPAGSFPGMLGSLPRLMGLAGIMPAKKRGRGECQQIIIADPDISILPVLKCWPHDGGRYITLPIVHTIHPVTKKPNAGMYRMQVIDGKTTAMHWQRHKTGAVHFEEYRRSGKRMPVSVALGGDPVYAYSATAPLPDGIDEYILAGFLRKKRVRMVRCITNELYVPDDADFIIEGYVDPGEDLFFEGPFGDHTGFYSLADWYPRFHITCITHRKNAVYPATIVGVPPQEDAWIAKATEKIFLSPVRMALQPEIEDFHMPDAGVAHNLVVIKIRKSYPGQGMKVAGALAGAGQMMFSKYMVVVSGDVDIRDYRNLAGHVFRNTDFRSDLIFSRGPLDVLDHASDAFSFGGKLGIDATVKLPEERAGEREQYQVPGTSSFHENFLRNAPFIENCNVELMRQGIPLVIVTASRIAYPDVMDRLNVLLVENDQDNLIRLVLVADHTVDAVDLPTVAWQVLGNTDPERDHFYAGHTLILDGTIKAFREGGFPRRWPNIVCSAQETIAAVDIMWNSLGLGPVVPSPSRRLRDLLRRGDDEILV